ncbi:sensor histidine kinase [Spirosoma montaniterrae]|nr:ATP-binding protein [Spirosoma montaniterrae]
MQADFERELLQTQLETQNHTLLQVAEELHDNVGQLLTVAVMRLNQLEDEVEGETAQQSVQQTREVIDTIIADVRSLAKTLDHNTVRRFGFLPSLTLELERIQRVGRVQTQLQTTGEPFSLGEQAETVLLRIAQESLNNAMKHAHASMLIVLVDYQPDSFTLTVSDNGDGFRVDEVNARLIDRAGSGLSNLQRRAKLLHGACAIESRPDAGTRVCVTLPRNSVN